MRVWRTPSRDGPWIRGSSIPGCKSRQLPSRDCLWAPSNVRCSQTRLCVPDDANGNTPAFHERFLEGNESLRIKHRFLSSMRGPLFFVYLSQFAGVLEL